MDFFINDIEVTGLGTFSLSRKHLSYDQETSLLNNAQYVNAKCSFTDAIKLSKWFHY